MQVMFSRRISNKNSPGYDRTQQGGNKWKFTVSPHVDQGKYLFTSFVTMVGGFIGGMVGLLVLAAIVAGTKGQDPDFGAMNFLAKPASFITGIFFSVWLTVFWRHSAKKGFQKQTLGRSFEFTVSADELTIDGKTFPASSIARVFTRNVMTGKETTSTTLIGTSGTMIAAGMTNALIEGVRQAREAQVAAVGNMVCFEAGGNRYPIGTALNEAQAFGLMKEVGDIMGFRSHS